MKISEEEKKLFLNKALNVYKISEKIKNALSREMKKPQIVESD